MNPIAMRRIPWSPWGLSLALQGDTRLEKTGGELAGVRKKVAGCLRELGL
jgi:hypothetical protein